MFDSQYKLVKGANCETIQASFGPHSFCFRGVEQSFLLLAAPCLALRRLHKECSTQSESTNSNNRPLTFKSVSVSFGKDFTVRKFCLAKTADENQLNI